MSSRKRAFENSRLVVLFAVITSVLAGLDLFFVVGLGSLRVFLSLAQLRRPAMALDQREGLLRQQLHDQYLPDAMPQIFHPGFSYPCPRNERALPNLIVN